MPHRLVEWCKGSTFFVLMLFASVSGAQESTELWPEVDVWVRLSPSTRLLLIGSVTKNRDSKYTEGTLGTNLDFVVTKFLSIRPGYWRIGSMSDATEPYYENRFMLDATLRAPLPAGFHVVNRNRGELRGITGEWSQRYRNRLRVERPLPKRKLHPLPYGSIELTFDSRYDAWNRTEYMLGCEFDVFSRSSLDLSMVRQLDPRNQAKRVTAFGITWNVSFDASHRGANQ
jgi:hypothetical protein